jgi:hypothetical protein
MYRSNPPIHVSILKALAILLASIVLIITIFLLFHDKILTFAVNAFTDCHVSYSLWEKDCTGNNVISDLRLNFKKYHFAVTAKEAEIDLKLNESFKQKKLIWQCKLKKIRFHPEEKKQASSNSPDSFFSMPFNSKWEYRYINFRAVYDGHSALIEDFDGFSDDIRVRGGGSAELGSQDLDVKMNIAVSPGISETLFKDLRENFLTKGTDGWYSTDVSISGNIKTTSFRLTSDFIDISVKSK